MIANLFRNLLASLSFFYKNNLELVKKKDKIILKTIQFRLNKLYQKHHNILPPRLCLSKSQKQIFFRYKLFF